MASIVRRIFSSELRRQHTNSEAKCGVKIGNLYPVAVMQTILSAATGG